MKKLLFAIIAFVFSSCAGGYSFTGASISPDTKTFFVDQFINRSSMVNPMLAPELTLALNTKVSSGTNLQSVNDNADISFKGTIIGYYITPVSIQGDDRASKNRLTISVRIVCVNRIDKKMNFEQTFSRFKDYDSALSLSDVEEALMKQINEELVEDIFNKAFVNW
ncbi:MAG: LptE family protein [Bacteroidales bacterium]|nr:LptE family protein [Bacteroidales bacterium]MDD4702895.1 LptE family protein [Bacteroidales bacterium]MDX9797564.1 LptE family protein [Bacteroidales bacterium]